MAKTSVLANPAVRQFFVAHQLRKAYEKLETAAKPEILKRLAATNGGVLFYTFDHSDQSESPKILTAGTALKATTSSKTIRNFIRPSDADHARLTPKQLKAITKFDATLVDAAVKSGTITVEQAAAIETVPTKTEFPHVTPAN